MFASELHKGNEDQHTALLFFHVSFSHERKKRIEELGFLFFYLSRIFLVLSSFLDHVQTNPLRENQK